ncbi:MAG: PEP-CTERM sorting domain-containing protein [Fimbriimonadaceae bacterium]
MKSTSGLLALAALTVVASSAQASTLTFNFSQVYTGDTPIGVSPYSTAVFTDTAANTVEMVLTHGASASTTQYLSELALNLDPGIGSITTTAIAGKVATFQSATVGGFTDAGTNFDFDVQFNTSNAGGGALRLNQGDSITLRFVGTGLSTANFNALSSGGTPVYALLHMQGTLPIGSTKLAGDPVPEPASMVILGGAVLAAVARRKRK